MRLVGGFSPSTPMVGSYSLIESILSEEGFSRFQAYLEKHPEMNERLNRSAKSCSPLPNGLVVQMCWNRM